MSRFVCTTTTEHADACSCDPDLSGHWCCKVAYWRSNGGLRLSSDALPHVRERDARHEPRQPDNSWEKAEIVDRRVDGTSMPLLDHQCLPVTNGEAKRHGGSSWVDRTMREIRRPDPQPAA